MSSISFTPHGMELIRQAANRQGSSVSQFVREAALRRASMAAEYNPYPMRTLAAQLVEWLDDGHRDVLSQPRPSRGPNAAFRFAEKDTALAESFSAQARTVGDGLWWRVTRS